jgi:hypothetical protein
MDKGKGKTHHIFPVQGQATCDFFPNIVGMEPLPEQLDAAPLPPTTQWPLLWKGIWAAIGLALIACLFTPLYKVLTAAFNGIDLARVLFEKDISEFARFIGEFTTFLMYVAPLLAAITGVWVLVQGLRALTSGRRIRWAASSALAGSAFIVFLVCQIKLDTPDGVFFFGKLMPKPAWGFYAEMFLLMILVGCGMVFAYLSRQQPAAESHVQP